jgi:cytochrome c-type biogenesis protein CcmE
MHVNKRARIRLIGVTAVILIAIAAVVIMSGNTSGAYSSSVASVTKDKTLIGKRVKVGGSVVPASWDKQSNPMRFTIRDEKDTAGTGPTVKVIYTGGVPSTFGDGVVAIVTGELAADGSIKATEMITKCPSKYESAEGALPVADLMKSGASMFGKTVKTTGYVKPGSLGAASADPRFTVTENADGTGASVPVSFTGVLPSGMKDGSQVVMGGALEKDGTFVATSVAMEQSQK